MTAVDTNFPIFYTHDVHGFYQKQKNEFHFQQKSDNDFLMFLLDTAVRVISIVQHLAPVIEAVSDASAEIDELEEMSPPHPVIPSAINNTVIMDVDAASPPAVPLLSAELEQINLEITNAQLSARHPRPQQLQSQPMTQQTQSMQQTPPVQKQAVPSFPAMRVVPPATIPPPEIQTVPQSAPQPVSSTQSAVSMNISTSQPSVTQPVAELPDSDFKTEEKPVPEVIEIKEEIAESAQSTNLLSPDTLQQLMTSISNNEDNIGLQNFVTTANPSNLPPSFLDRSSTNPLSMLGSVGGEAPGPSGINVPNIGNIPESMMKNISDAGLNVASIKGQANPSASSPRARRRNGSPEACPYCQRVFGGSRPKSTLKRHVQEVHLGLKKYECPTCPKKFFRKEQKVYHMRFQCGKGALILGDSKPSM